MKTSQKWFIFEQYHNQKTGHLAIGTGCHELKLSDVIERFNTIEHEREIIGG